MDKVTVEHSKEEQLIIYLRNRVSDHRAYCRKFIKPTINKIAA